MTIEELNKLIKEELDAYMGEAEDEVTVTTDEEDLEGGTEEFKDALSKIRDLINDLLPDSGEEVEPEPEDEPEEEDEPEYKEEKEDAEEEEDTEEEEMEEAVGYPNYKADQVQKTKADADDVNKGLNESMLRMQKLAGLITESDIKKKLSLNEEISPLAQALIQVFKDEIEAEKREKNEDGPAIQAAYRKGIEMLKSGKDPKTVNDKVQGLYIKATGDSSYDPAAMMNLAKKKAK